jgi:hypothetical protein
VMLAQFVLASLGCSTTILGVGTAAYICLELQIKGQSEQRDPDPKSHGIMAIVLQRQQGDERIVL